MELDDSQKNTLRTWIDEGKSLSEVQQLLRSEFGLSMTYMDVRFLVDDLDIQFKEPEEPAASEVAEAPADPGPAPDAAPGTVRVEVDSLVRPGAMVSGNVTFSDGKSMGWQLDSAGRLGLLPGTDPEYRPSPEDVDAFQRELETVLQKQGF